MGFDSPWWLLVVAPWLAVLVWILTGRYESSTVPFLHLWKGPQPILSRARASWNRPPIAILLLLLAALLGIFAAARPGVVGFGQPAGEKIAIIIDRGMTMTVRVNGQPRWKELASRIQLILKEHFGNGPVDLILLPDGHVLESSREAWVHDSDANEPEPRDTRAQLSATISRALADASNHALIVLTDQPIAPDNSRLIQIAPENQPSNIGIVAVEMRRDPYSQAMLRIRNDSPLTSTAVSVAGESATISLPARGEEKNYFFNVPRMDAPLTIQLTTDDDLPIDNSVVFHPAKSGARVEAAGEISPTVVRMISTYNKVRQGTGEVVRVGEQFSSNLGPAVFVAHDLSPANATNIQADLTEIFAHLTWPAESFAGFRVSDSSPGDGWTVIARAGGKPIVATRTSPARQVWVGFDSDTFSHSPEFVIFWTNVFDWTGGDAQRIVAQFNPAVPMLSPVASNWTTRLANMPTPRTGIIDLTPFLALAALGLIFAAALFWGTCKICAVG